LLLAGGLAFLSFARVMVEGAKTLLRPKSEFAKVKEFWLTAHYVIE
jgi:hypothetical protein